jgi:hypothetical protein
LIFFFQNNILLVKLFLSSGKKSVVKHSWRNFDINHHGRSMTADADPTNVGMVCALCLWLAYMNTCLLCNLLKSCLFLLFSLSGYSALSIVQMHQSSCRHGMAVNSGSYLQLYKYEEWGWWKMSAKTGKNEGTRKWK